MYWAAVIAGLLIGYSLGLWVSRIEAKTGYADICRKPGDYYFAAVLWLWWPVYTTWMSVARWAPADTLPTMLLPPLLVGLVWGFYLPVAIMLVKRARKLKRDGPNARQRAQAEGPWWNNKDIPAP